MAAAFLVAAATLAAPVPAVAADAVRNRLIVGFESRQATSRAEAIVRAAGGELRRRFDHIRAASVRTRAGRPLKALRRALRRHPGVRYVEPDFILRASKTPDDPYFPRQYGLGAPPGGVSAPAAWDGRTSCAKVATLDSGAQNAHPDLKGNIWHNPDEVNANGKDDDKNGWVDDYYGVDVYDGKGNAKDEDGHGTHVAGIIAGHGNNATGVTGTCWTAKVMPVRFMSSSGRGSTSDAITGLDYAIHEGAKIVNCSFGSSSKSSSLEDAIEHAHDKNVLLVVAAGNDGESLESHPEYPASYTDANIITVAAITSSGALASFSNFGSKSVDLGAPGDDIWSTYKGSAYKQLSGTSMAAPYVAGAAAMLKGKDSSLSYSDLRSKLKSTVDPLSSLQGKTTTGGRLNLQRALAAVG
jgi:subtilisin family serine protease